MDTTVSKMMHACVKIGLSKYRHRLSLRKLHQVGLMLTCATLCPKKKKKQASSTLRVLEVHMHSVVRPCICRVREGVRLKIATLLTRVREKDTASTVFLGNAHQKGDTLVTF